VAFLAFLQKNIWITELWLALVLCIVFHLLWSKYCNKIKNYFSQKKYKIRLALFDAMQKPLSMLVWVQLALYIVKILNIQFFAFSFLAFTVSKFQYSVCILSFLWALIRFESKVEDIYIKKHEHMRDSRMSIRAFATAFRVCSILLSILLILNTFGVSFSALIAFAGAGSIVIGFAAKDLLANFFGSVMLFFDRPFVEGDWIRSNDREIEGFVEKIGLRLTTIRTFDKRALYIPNSVFSNIAIENPSRMTNRRIKTVIALRYEDASKIKAVVDDIRNMLKKHKEIDQNRVIIVNFTEFNTSSLDIMVYAFTRKTGWEDFQEIKQQVYLKTLEIVKSHGAECAYPASRMLFDSASDKDLVKG
jgi:MscS family membrane protein